MTQAPGQLGNQLALFAHLIGCAKEHGLRLMNSSFHEYAGFFRGTCADVFCRFPQRKSLIRPNAATSRAVLGALLLARHTLTRFHSDRVSVIQLPSNGKFDLDEPNFVDRARRGVILLKGWLFRSHRDLQRHSSVIREYFEPVAAVANRARTAVESARDGIDVLVGAHLRQGADTRTWRGGRYALPTKTYLEIMRSVRDQRPRDRVGFLVCSDVPRTAGEFEDLQVSHGPGDVVADLYALARCDYIIGVPSTFSMWAAFYGGRPIYQMWDPQHIPSLEELNVPTTVS